MYACMYVGVCNISMTRLIGRNLATSRDIAVPRGHVNISFACVFKHKFLKTIDLSH